MKILHYALGFPPYRTGGLTKFCMDLLGQQSADGHQTALAWPGSMAFFWRKVSVKERKMGGIQSFEICNPLPIPYDEGIARCELFMEDTEGWVYKELFKAFCPDVIHIHTLMGLHSSFLRIAKEMGIRCVFTAHDYFPICPKVTMIRGGQVCSSAENCMGCGICNETALKIGHIKILQSVSYRIFKDTPVVRRLRSRHREYYLSGNGTDHGGAAVADAAEYRRLRRHYHALLKKMDLIHYNSTLTRSVYEKYFQLPNSVVINISHGDIKDCRKKKRFSKDKCRMAYLGPQGEAKGFFYSRRRLINCGKQINSLVWIYILSQQSCRLI